MLINEPNAVVDDPISIMIGQINGNTFSTFQVNKDQLHTEAVNLHFEPPMVSEPQVGCYIRGGFGGSPWLPGYETFPELIGLGEDKEWESEYGVCDCVQQVLDTITTLHVPDRKFVVMFTPVLKKNQSPEGGWRWHKWGPYIGKHDPQHEYLYDEPDIDGVLVYNIYEWIGGI